MVYTGRRTRGEQAYRLRLRVGAPLQQAAFDVWLTGRWRAYTERGRRLLVTPLEHEPWSLASAETLEQNLTTSAGLPPPQATAVALFAHAVERVRLGMPRAAAT